MFTRLIKGQLAAFVLLTVFAVSVIAVNYLDLPQLLGFEQYRVTVQFTNADGLYPSGEVTYRGIPIGRIEKIELGPDRVAQVRLAINNNARVPSNLTARAVSMSALGERSVELVPAGPAGPYLQPGAVIPTARSVALQPEAQILQSLDGLLTSVPKPQLTQLLDEVTVGFSHGSQTFGPVLDANSRLVGEAQANIAPTQSLLAGLGPFLREQLAAGQDLRAYSHNLALFTDQLRASDADLRGVLHHTPPALTEINKLLHRIGPNLTPMLDNFTDVGWVLNIYRPSLEQVLAIYPALVAAIQVTTMQPNTDAGTLHLALRTNIGQPPPCYSGYLPLTQQRDFRIETPIKNLPNDLYCKVAHDDPRDVRGVRNIPCLNAPGVRAASVEECLGRPLGSLRRFETAGSPRPGK